MLSLGSSHCHPQPSWDFHNLRNSYQREKKCSGPASQHTFLSFSPLLSDTRSFHINQLPLFLLQKPSCAYILYLRNQDTHRLVFYGANPLVLHYRFRLLSPQHLVSILTSPATSQDECLFWRHCSQAHRRYLPARQKHPAHLLDALRTTRPVALRTASLTATKAAPHRRSHIPHHRQRQRHDRKARHRPPAT